MLATWIVATMSGLDASSAPLFAAPASEIDRRHSPSCGGVGAVHEPTLPCDTEALAGTRPWATLPAIAALASPKGPRLRLLLFDVHELLGPATNEVIEEVSGMLREAGVPSSWVMGGMDTVYGSAEERELAIIVLRAPPAALANAKLVMGLVPRAAGRQPVWIFADNIRRTLWRNANPQPLERRAHELAVAAARVVVHELVHALVPERPHTLDGLMKHSLNRGELVGPRPAIPPESAAAMRAALTSAPRAEAAAPAATRTLARELGPRR